MNLHSQTPLTPPEGFRWVATDFFLGFYLAHETAEIHPTARIASGVRVEAGARIGANTHIFDGCRIGPNTVIGETVEIWENTQIGANVEIGDFSQLFGNHRIDHNARIADHVQIGSHTYRVGYAYSRPMRDRLESHHRPAIPVPLRGERWA